MSETSELISKILDCVDHPKEHGIQRKKEILDVLMEAVYALKASSIEITCLREEVERLKQEKLYALRPGAKVQIRPALGICESIWGMVCSVTHPPHQTATGEWSVQINGFVSEFCPDDLCIIGDKGVVW